MKNTFKIGYILCLLFLLLSPGIKAQTKTPIKRPISSSSPMWLIHIDTWIWPDPQKCIDLIPKDIRPFVVMNISMSVSDFVKGKYPYTIAESWLRTCAENRMWAMIQPSSGFPNNFSETDLEVYEYFYAHYPNFIGWNFCEQNWGFPGTAEFITRLDLFTNLLKFANKYGGYLAVSNFMSIGNYTNAVGKLKARPSFTEACKTYKDNYIVLDKNTSIRGFYDNESGNLGTWLSGYAGNYGLRFDQCGWDGQKDKGYPFPESSGAISFMEHFMLTGATVMDGPELTWQQTIKQAGTYTTGDGFTAKKFDYFPQFSNINFENFRKVLDKTIPIPSREQVIARTKIAFVNDINNGIGLDTYSTTSSLFTGLYAMDGELNDNLTWFKKTGRYPSIPMIFKSGTYETGAFEKVVAKSGYSQRWPTQQTKVNEFNSMFPEEYKGDMFVARTNNNWLTYNPLINMPTPSQALIPLKYNTCDSISLSYSPYSMGVLNEFGDKLNFYLNNYCTDASYGMRTDVIKVYGSTNEPTYTFTDRDNHLPSTVSKTWANGILTLTILHNGPLDLTINCAGTASGRLTNYPESPTIIAPAMPSMYSGPRQYEAENFDYKNVTSVTQTTLANYTAMGYVNFGTNSAASIRDTVYALKSGMYVLKIKYSASAGNISLQMRVNGVKKILSLLKTESDTSWAVNTQTISLKAGMNTIQFSSNGSTNNLYLDNIILEREDNGSYTFSNDVATTDANTPAAELLTVKSGSAGVVSFTDVKSETSNCFKAYSAGTTNGTGVADLNLFPDNVTNYSMVWKEYFGIAGGKKGILMRGTDTCTYATGMKQGYLFIVLNNADSTVTLKPYVANASGLIAKPTFTTSFKVIPGQACWFRASTEGNQITFECSTDSLTWVGSLVASYTDETYTTGSTQLIWGLNANNFGWMMDNITQQVKNRTVSQVNLTGFRYVQGSGPSPFQSFKVSGSFLSENIEIQAPENFEVSLSTSSGYASSLSISQINGTIPATAVYLRLKEGLGNGSYNGDVIIHNSSLPNDTISLSGSIVPQAVSRLYNFTSDLATTYAKTPPALNTVIGLGNGATAGVVSYKDATSITSNVFKVYSGGLRNSTGIVDLNLFSRKSTDYSVTWKQYVGSTSSDYKVGILLRGDTSKIGDGSTGYVQGMMQGYLLLVYTAGTAATKHTEFRIYKSTSTFSSLTTMTNISVNSLLPAVGQPIWYRASVSGSSPVTLTFEYSTDGTTWNTGATSSDLTSPTYTSGATQIVWGLGVNNVDFYMDDIAFYGIESITGTPTNLPLTETGSKTIVSQEIYNLTGLRVRKEEHLKGLLLVRNRFSDGSVTSSKIFFK